MSGNHQSHLIFLIDAVTEVNFGVVGQDGREWLWPTALVLAPDGGAALAQGARLLSDHITMMPKGVRTNGADYIFAAAFTLNNGSRVGRLQRRALLVSPSGQPIGVHATNLTAAMFATPPVLTY